MRNGDGAPSRCVLVLKEKSSNAEDEQQDPYEVALQNAGYSARFLPVLAHRLVNLETIRNVIAGDHNATPTSEATENGHANVERGTPFAGVVFTSQRAVAAWAEAARTIIESRAQGQLQWSSVPFYAVGPATASALLRLDDRLRPPASLILGAEESGSAERLASYITSRTSPPSAADPNPPLLYLVGDKRKDTLPSLLKRQGIRMHEIQAYETFQSPTFEGDYDALKPYEPFEWIVFFSPSGAKLLLPLLQREKLDAFPRFAAIGPTTRDYLLSHDGIRVSAMAESPTPESLVSAMLALEAP